MEDEVKRIVFETKGKVDEMSNRLNHLGDEIIALRGEMIKQGEELSGRIDGLKDSLIAKIDSNFKRLVGIILGTVLPMWITIILAILFK